jgi:L-lactate permease
MIETLIEIITKTTDLATYSPVWLVLIISLIVMYIIIARRVGKALASVVDGINDALSILLSELRARNIIPYEVVRDVLDKLPKSREVVTVLHAEKVARKAKFKYLSLNDIEKAKAILSKKELSEEDITELNRIAHLIFYEWKKKPGHSDLLTAYILLRLLVSSRHSGESAQQSQTSEGAKS